MTLMTSDRVIIGNSNGSNNMTPATVTLSLRHKTQVQCT